MSEKLAGIVLPDSEGRPVRLGSLWAAEPAVSAFLRHHGVIFCREHIAQLRDHEQSFRDKGARLVAIGLGNENYAQVFREETGITFPLLVDAERQAYRAVGLLGRATCFAQRFTRCAHGILASPARGVL